MLDFMIEYLLLSFTMGAILGGAITGHVVFLFSRRPAPSRPRPSPHAVAPSPGSGPRQK